MVDRMNRADSITNGAFHELARLERGLNGCFHVTDIVHGIEDTEYVDSIGRCRDDKGPNDIIRVVAIADHVLPAHEHLKPRLRHCGAECAKPLPGTFVQTSKTRVEGRPTPGLERPVADLVEL